MGIKGFQGTSLLDFPGRIASLIFFGGCNLTCPFCHNPDLVLRADEFPDYPLEAVLDELRERRRFIDGVVISGGEPTLAAALPDLLAGARELGLAIKLDTNGLTPATLRSLLAGGLVDYLALDLKTAPRRYGELHGAPVATDALAETVALLREGDLDYEIRTTCVPGLVDEEEIAEIGAFIRGARRWFLQQFAPRHALAASLQQKDPYPPARLEEFARRARDYAEKVALRGV